MRVADDNGKIIPGEVVVFYANYTNRTSSELVDGVCNITLDGSLYSMELNTLYNYSASFDDLRVRSYSVPYIVNCSADGFESLGVSSSLDVELNATLLRESSTMEAGEMIILADIDNNTLIDMLIGGNNNDERILRVYNSSGYLIEAVDIYAIVDGSLGLIDYDNDGDLDIGQTGLAQSGGKNINVSRILEND